MRKGRRSRTKELRPRMLTMTEPVADADAATDDHEHACESREIELPLTIDQQAELQAALREFDAAEAAWRKLPSVSAADEFVRAALRLREVLSNALPDLCSERSFHER